jgi:tetratricopeptide (TPR) repeat protein
MAINDQEPTLTLMPRARAAANKALELRPGFPDALVSLGCVKSIFDWDWEGGARDLEEATRRQPGSATPHAHYAVFNLQARGMWDAAIEHMRTAMRLDPVAHVPARDLGLIHFMRRDWDEAERSWRLAEDLSPGYRGCMYWRARMAIETGRCEEAITALEARWSADPTNSRVLATIGYAWARDGESQNARAIIDDLTARASCTRVPPLNFAIVWLGLKEWDRALDCLEQACQERAAALYQFGVDPLYDPIRAHPRGEALRLAMRLPITSS